MTLCAACQSCWTCERHPQKQPRPRHLGRNMAWRFNDSQQQGLIARPASCAPSSIVLEKCHVLSDLSTLPETAAVGRPQAVGRRGLRAVRGRKAREGEEKRTRRAPKKRLAFIDCRSHPNTPGQSGSRRWARWQGGGEEGRVGLGLGLGWVRSEWGDVGGRQGGGVV